MLRARIRKALTRFVRDDRAVAALEFALIAPMMLFVAFGTVEITYALQANRRVENVASSLADVISRDDVVTNTEMTDLWTASQPLMWPNTDVGLQARVSSISIITASRAEVTWSDGHGGYAPLSVGETVQLPAGMMIPGTSVIMGEVIYPYNPAIGFVFGPHGLHSLLNPTSHSSGVFNITHSAVRRARIVDPVQRVVG